MPQTITIPSDKPAYNGFREFTWRYCQDEYGQANVYVTSTDEGTGNDPVVDWSIFTVTQGDAPNGGIDWSNPLPQIAAGIKASYIPWTNASVNY